MNSISLKSVDIITLRSVEPLDVYDLFNWRNDEITRLNSHNLEPISFAQHNSWFEASIANAMRQIFIAVENNRSVGMIRVDSTNIPDQRLLSWMVAPESRGKGVGTRMLSQICLVFENLDLVAEIKSTNAASLAMVASCGFTPDSKIGGVESWIRFRVKNSGKV
jgi:RimJ/RimL family protein N-acetyltransferase